jgi:hypothetical protein
MRGWKVGLAAVSAWALIGASDRDPLATEMLAAHNAVRADVDVPPVTWDDRLAEDAQDYAAYMADTGRYQHSTFPRGRDPAGEGENMFRGTEGGYSIADMIEFWVAERRYFIDGAMPDISNSGRWQDAGHYSQMVWRATTRIGCGVATGRGYDYLVCRYSSPGNVMGRKAY